MVGTIIRTYANADFSAKNIGYIDPEPAWDLPVGNLMGAWRFGRTLDLSMKNKVTSGGWGDLVVGGANPAVSMDGVTLNSTAFLYRNANGFQAPMTMITVYESAETPVSQMLGGFRSSSQPTLYLSVGSSGGVAVAARKDSATPVTTVGITGAVPRFELVAGVFDTTENLMKVSRPRTGSTAQIAFSDWTPNTSSAYRLGQDTSSIKIAAHVVYTRALTDAEVTQVYSTIKASLAVSSINI